MATRVLKRVPGFLSLLALVLLAGVPDVAAEPAADLTVTVIHAKRGPPFLHPALKPMWTTLQKSFGDKFAHYDQISTASRRLALGERLTVSTPDGGTFSAIYQGVTESKGLLRIHLEFGDFRTKVRVHDGGVFFQAGKRHQGGTLVVAVSAALRGAGAHD
jgi:hypothetical protein